MDETCASKHLDEECAKFFLCGLAKEYFVEESDPKLISGQPKIR
jgi:hypothetical protein